MYARTYYFLFAIIAIPNEEIISLSLPYLLLLSMARCIFKGWGGRGFLIGILSKFYFPCYFHFYRVFFLGGGVAGTLVNVIVFIYIYLYAKIKNPLKN